MEFICVINAFLPNAQNKQMAYQEGIPSSGAGKLSLVGRAAGGFLGTGSRDIKAGGGGARGGAT